MISVYLLSTRARSTASSALLPPGDGSAADDYPLGCSAPSPGYVRGQLAFSMIMGATAGVALWIFGVPVSSPTVEPRLCVRRVPRRDGARAVHRADPRRIPAVAVALFQNPLSAVWVTLLFVGLQQLEGHIVAPQIFSHALRINPILVILALLFGDAIYGLVGALVALPVAAVVRETVTYLRRHVILEPWHAAPPIW